MLSRISYLSRSCLRPLVVFHVWLPRFSDITQLRLPTVEPLAANAPHVSHSQPTENKKKRSDLKIAIQHQFPIGPLPSACPGPTKQQPEHHGK